MHEFKKVEWFRVFIMKREQISILSPNTPSQSYVYQFAVTEPPFDYKSHEGERIRYYIKRELGFSHTEMKNQ